MALHSLPTLTEKAFVDHLSSSYSGTHSIIPAFSVKEYHLPLIMVKAARFSPLEPGTHLYRGQVMISVHTQIDDVENPIGQHDAAVAELYDLISDKNAALASFNAQSSFHCWNFDIAAFDQEVGERDLNSLIELSIECQTRDVS